MTKTEHKKLEWFSWYPALFRADTQRLTRDERHAYRDLLDEMFVTDQATCSLPDDDELLARIVGRTVEEWRAMRAALLDGSRPLLKKRRGQVYSKRLLAEVRKAREKSDKARESAERSHSERKANAKRTQNNRTTNAEHSHSDRTAIKSKNKKNPTDSKKEKEPVLTPPLPRNGLEALDAVEAVLTKYAPLVHVSEEQVLVWLEDTIHDGWQLAAALAEEATDLHKAHTAAYLTTILARKASTGWSCEDAEGYVRVALSRPWPVQAVQA